MLLKVERKQSTEGSVGSVGAEEAEEAEPQVVEVSLIKGENGLGISIVGGKGGPHENDTDGMLLIVPLLTG